MNNPMQMIQAFINFKNSYSGNPEQDVQNLLASGRLNQNQLNQLQNMARTFQTLLNGYI